MTSKRTFSFHFQSLVSVALLLIFTQLLVPYHAHSHGDEEQQIELREENIGKFTKSIEELLDNVDKLIIRYNESGKVDSEYLVHYWEEAAIHLAIEKSYPPLYGEIWSALTSMKTAFEQRKSADSVQMTRNKLEQNLWQALGAVKLAVNNRSQSK